MITKRGATVVQVDGRPVSLWPYVPGEWLDVEDADLCLQAARILAQVHRVLVDSDIPPRTERIVEPGLEDRQLDRWLDEFAQLTRVHHPLHGDFYRGNLLVHGGRITAVLDWDEAWVGPPEFEVASAARELGSRWGTDLRPAQRFVAEYVAAGGTAQRLDDVSLAQLIRRRLRCEDTAFHLSLDEGAMPSAEDRAYHERVVELFHALRP